MSEDILNLLLEYHHHMCAKRVCEYTNTCVVASVAPSHIEGSLCYLLHWKPFCPPRDLRRLDKLV